jgi:hypothetical protein
VSVLAPVWRFPLAAVAAAAVLVGAYAALGGTHYEALQPPSPCRGEHWHAPSGTNDLVNQLVLSTLDGAACRLHVSRESLALSLSSAASRARFAKRHNLSPAHIQDAIRAGLVQAVNDASDAGVINGLEAFLLRQVAERIPAEQLIPLAQRLSGLLG